MIDAASLMRRLAGLLVIGLALGLGGCAASGPAPQAGSSPQSAPAVWRVQDEDSTVWLFGSVHILNRDVRWQTPLVRHAIDQSDTIYFETETGPGAQPKFAAFVAQHGVNPPGVTLRSLLDETQYADFESAAQRVGLRAADLDRLRPWFASVLLGVQAIIAEGGDPDAGVEQVIARRAARRSKQVRHFESIEEQLGFWSSLSPETELALFTAGNVHVAKQSNHLPQLVTAWQAGDVELLTELIAASYASSPETYDALIVTRNHNWLPMIEAELNEVGGVTFVTVGAGHLTLDEDSLLTLLRARGWTVQRL